MGFVTEVSRPTATSLVEDFPRTSPCVAPGRRPTLSGEERVSIMKIGWNGGAARARRWVGLALVVVASACVVETTDELGPEPRDASLPWKPPVEVARVPAPLPAAHCDVLVDGTGVVDLEDDYLPHVIQCENGGANLEALKAQAIAARSVAYYSVETSGSICDSQGCQVYSCGATPQAIHYQAVEETSGQYLMYNNTLTYGFYVAGDNNTSPPACVGVSGATEGWVTYNEGQTGTDVEQTALGFIHDPADFGYGQNRGCMSQWGARCLENNNGYDALDILRFYYGDDIQVIQAEGECVLPLPGDDSSSGDPGPTSGDPGDTSGPGPGPDDTTGAGEGPDPEASTGGDPLPGGTAEDAGDPPPDDAGDTGVDPALPGTFGGDQDQGGCACRSASGDAWGWWMFLPLGLLGVRRRR